MNKLKTSQPVGILNVDYFQNNFSLSTYYPKEHLQDYIEHYWLISWDIPKGQSHRQDVIPHPSTHLTFLKNNSHIQGICKQKYSHTLQGSGNIVGIKFKPAGFFPFAKKSGVELKNICDKSIDINTIFDIDIAKTEQHVLNLDEPMKKIDYIDQLFFSQLVMTDENIVRLNEIVAAIAANKEIMKVSDICSKFNINQRHLQRLFVKYIGVSVKWVINRYRMHEALMSVETNKNIDWAMLAIKLGYYDQAHFIKDFKNLIGKTPKNYHSTIDK
ncbi:MAG: helix-turn-helix transcriptional regulator [Colwellia sp.]|nr:helix-turn-helix transcriptional regulator [Colwellia sp.]